MDLPAPRQAVTAVATYVRDRLTDVVGTISPRLVLDSGQSDPAALVGARQLATVIAGAAAPFAQTSYSRARLIRQLHASGMLAADDARRVT